MDQAQGLREMFQNPKAPDKASGGTHVITIASGKGGVGKSFFTVNLGVLLAKRGMHVTIMDADFGLANINVILGVLPKFNLYHVYKREKKLDEIILNVADNLDIIAGASGVAQLANMSEADRKHFIKSVGDLKVNDFLLIDVGAGISPNVLDMITAARETFIVTTPEPTAVTDCYGTIKSIVHTDKNVKINLIINRAHNFQEAKATSQRIINITEQFLDIRIHYAGFIFEDEHVVKSIHEQDPLVNSYAHCRASICLEDIVERLLSAHQYIPAKKRNLNRFFRQWLKLVKPKDAA